MYLPSCVCASLSWAASRLSANPPSCHADLPPPFPPAPANCLPSNFSWLDSRSSCFWWHNVNVRTFVFRWTESMIPSWHTMGECFVKWLADWLKCWMRQRRKSTMRYSLENFCCISLKIFGEADTPIRIYAHPSNPVKQSEKCLAKLMSGKKTCVFLSAAGLLFWKNWKELTFNTCHCCRFSNGDIDKLLRNYWNHMFSVDVERFCEMEVNLGETNLWGEGDRVKWGTCGPRATPIWCLNAIQMWQPARSSTFRFALPIAPSRVISVL